MAKSKKPSIVAGSGNVFDDLGLPNAEEHQLKAELVSKLADLIKAQHLTQVEVAQKLHVTQPDISKMLRGHFRQFSVERLLKFIAALGASVVIHIGVPAAGTRTKRQQITVSS